MSIATFLVLLTLAACAYFFFSHQEKKEKARRKAARTKKVRKNLQEAALRVLPPESHIRQMYTQQANEEFWADIEEERRRKKEETPDGGLKY